MSATALSCIAGRVARIAIAKTVRNTLNAPLVLHYSVDADRLDDWPCTPLPVATCNPLTKTTPPRRRRPRHRRRHRPAATAPPPPPPPMAPAVSQRAANQKTTHARRGWSIYYKPVSQQCSLVADERRLSLTRNHATIPSTK